MRTPLFLFLISFSLLCWSQPATFAPHGIGGGGALHFPSINPANDDEFYIGCDMSELFHSTDFGKNYSVVPFTSLAVLSTSTYEFTSDPQVAYSVYNDGNEGYPVKTTDGGVTWIKLTGYDPGLGRVYRLMANYDNPGQVVMNYYGDIVISNKGGSSFTVVKHAANMGSGIILGGVAWDDNEIYIATNEGIFHSPDAGISFSKMTETGIPSGQVIWNFCGARAGNTLRFICITSDPSYTYTGVMPYDYYNFAKGVYAMDNASGTWTSRSAGIDFASDFVMYAGMARNDINTVYLAGNDHALGAPLIFKSPDGGNNWTKVFNTTSNANISTGWCGSGGDKAWSWAESAFGIAVAPLNSGKIVFGDYSCVHVSEDGGVSWTEAYLSDSDKHPQGAPTPPKQSYHTCGIENTTCWQVFWIDSDKMFGAFSDMGGIRSEDKGASWSYNYNGFNVNSLYRIARTPDGTLFAATSRVHDLYESTRLKDAQLDVSDYSGNIYYSKDDGDNWTVLHAFGHPVYWIATDPANPGRMYASIVHYGTGGSSTQGGIWMTNDLGGLAASQWTRLSQPARTEGHPAVIEVLNDGKMVCSFSGRINPSGSFTASSGVFIYDPGLNQWSDVSDPGMYYWSRDIVIDPNDTNQNTWLAGVFSGWGGPPNGLGGLYRTANRGLSWTKLTGSQFDRVTSVTFNPQNTDQAYLTTETQGLWVSNNIEDPVPSWTLLSNYPFRQPERVFFNPHNPNEMWVTSFGNGLRAGVTYPASIDQSGKDHSGYSVTPNPSNGLLRINCPANDLQINCSIIDASGKVSKTWSLKSTKSGIQVDLGSLENGIYTLMITDRQSVVFSDKIILVKNTR